MASISIITASYNCENTIENTIESVINQTYDDWELIIVDDGSQDKSLEIIKKYSEKNPKIKYFTHKGHKNKGLKETIKHAISKVKTEWIHFLECDDILKQDALAKKIQIAKGNPSLSLIFSEVEMFGDKDIISSHSRYMNDRLNIIQNKKYPCKILKESIHINLIPTFSVVMCKTEKLKKCSFNTPIDAYLDWFLWSQLADEEVFYINEPLTLWCIRPDSYIQIKKISNYDKRKYQIIIENNIRKEKFIKRHIQLCLYDIKYILKKIFSIRNSNDKKHKIITIAGFKFSIKKAAKKMKLLVHFHLYYHNQIDYFIEKLSNIEGCEWDLAVTYVEENLNSMNKILELKPNAKFIEVNNVGYDIWPFIQIIQNINLDNYDFVLKIHTKRYLNNIYWPNDYIYKTKNKGFHWRNTLMEALLGSKEIFKNNLNKLSNQNIGFISDKSYTISIEKNSNIIDIKNVNNLKEKLKIKTNYDKFLAGTMFFIKSSVLKNLLALDIKEADFDTINKPGISSTFAHSLERIFLLLVVNQNYEIYLRDNLKLKVQYYFYKTILNIFSLRNSKDKRHKIITIFGIKISIKRNIRSNDSKENKKISVVVPVYNVEPNFIETAINSVLNQTYKNIEIILVNDGSTDENTLNYLKTINNPQIKIINQENKGLGGARNTGIKNSTGEYIGFLDSDDWLDSNFYETLYKLCEENNADIACGILTRTGLDFEYPMDNFDNCVISNFAKKMKYITNGSTCSKLFRKKLFSDIRFHEHTYYEDNPVLIRLFMKSKNAAFTNSVKYYYRVNDKSITLDETHKQKIKKDCLAILKDICSILKNKSQKEKDIVLVRFVPNLIRMNFYNEDLDYQRQVNKVLGRKYKKYLKLPRNTFIQNIFSLKNSSDKKHKIITIFGLKIKIKRK